MNAPTITAYVAAFLAVVQFCYLVYKERKGGFLQKGQAEAQKAVLETAQTEASLPHVQESLKLGNVSDAVEILQGVIVNLREHIKWQDAELEKCH